MANIVIEGKVIGQRRPLFTDWEMPVPPGWESAVRPPTLRELIEEIVRAEVSAFHEREERRSMIQTLTQADIERGLMKGKVDSGGRPVGAPVDPAAAVATAMQAFQDGLYYVFIDEEQQTELDAPVAVRAESRITFLRLVALAGG